MVVDLSQNIRHYNGMNSGGYWRSWDGSVERRFVTENETQILTNKTLTSPTLTSPNIGAAIATSINGLDHCINCICNSRHCNI